MPLSYGLTGKCTPFVYCLFPLIIGIIVGWRFCPFSYFSPLFAVVLFVLLALGMAFLSRRKSETGKKMANAPIYFLLVVFGSLLSWWHNDSLSKNYAGRYLRDSSYVKVLLESPLSEKAHSWKASVRILAVKNGKQIVTTKGKAFLYFQKRDTPLHLQYGDILIFPKTLQRIKNAGNPGEFDYQRYCRAKNIRFSGYVRENQWLLVKRKAGNKLKSFFIRLRKKCIEELKKYIPSVREAGVGVALLLGYRADLDPKLVQAFANIGVVHLIAISGLHVGLIYLILLWLFSLLPKQTENLQGVLICLCLWGFALLTGAHPSTLRATVMFSCFAVGKFFFHRRGESLNLLAASAFLLLSFQPYLLFDVGFQLSYLAVAGILAFQKPLRNLFWSRYRLLRYFGEMLAVSLSAQVFVFPLVLFYFHQFPTLFLLSNLVLIPVATLALYGEVLLLMLSFLSGIAEYVGWIVSKILFLMNEIVLWINHIPFVRWEYFHLSILKLCCLYLLILLLCLGIRYKYKRAFIYSLMVIAFIFIIGIGSEIKRLRQKKVIVYNTPGSSMIELVSGKKSKLISHKKDLEKSDLWEYTLQPSKEALHIEERTIKEQPAFFFTIAGKRLVRIDKGFSPAILHNFFPVDYVILSHYNQLSMKDIMAYFSPKVVVFDASVYNWQREKWNSACKKLNLLCFSVIGKGAWCLSIKK